MSAATTRSAVSQQSTDPAKENPAKTKWEFRQRHNSTDQQSDRSDLGQVTAEAPNKTEISSW